MLQNSMQGMGLSKEQANQHPEIGQMHMLQSIADSIEIARSILFLASEDASYIIGENLMVDAGYVQQ